MKIFQATDHFFPQSKEADQVRELAMTLINDKLKMIKQMEDEAEAKRQASLKERSQIKVLFQMSQIKIGI